MNKFSWFVVTILAITLLLSLLENNNLRIHIDNLKLDNEICQNVSEGNYNNLKHTLEFLETIEHAKDNYQKKMLEYKDNLQECEENKPDFLWIAETIANNNEWVAKEYDCTEFSNDLVYELRKNGYKARVVHGYDYYINGTTCEGQDLEIFNCRHDWVCLGEEFDYGICIEAVRGTIIPHSQYGKKYVFRGEGEWN